MAEAEQLVLSTDDSAQYLLNIAYAYLERGDVENASRLAEEILAGIRNGDGRLTDAYTRSDVAYLFFDIGNYSRVLELSAFVDDLDVFSSIAIQLIEAGDDDVAWQVFEQITSPAWRVDTLVQMAQIYQDLGQVDAAYDLAVRAVRITSSPDFSQDDYFSDSSGYSKDYLGQVSEADIVNLAKYERETLVESILYLSDSSEEMRSLIQLIEDDARRNQFLEIFFLEETVVHDSTSPVELPTTDYDLSSMASTAAREERFQSAMEAVAIMESPAQQSRTLLNIAKCYANGTTPLAAGTTSVLNQIQQRYQ